MTGNVMTDFSSLFGATPAAHGMLVKKQENEEKRKQNIQKILWQDRT